MAKTFGFYCSGNASRVIGFFSCRDNHKKYIPEFIVYDGDNLGVLNSLIDLFGKEKLIKVSNEEDISIVIFNNMRDRNTDYLICFGNQILKGKLLKKYDNCLINFHPSLLPAFKGLKAIDKALGSQVSFIGNSVHYISEKVDSGEIIAQSAMLTEDFNEYEDVFELQYPLMKLVFRDLLKYEVSNEEVISELTERVCPYFLPKQINVC